MSTFWRLCFLNKWIFKNVVCVGFGVFYVMNCYFQYLHWIRCNIPYTQTFVQPEFLHLSKTRFLNYVYVYQHIYICTLIYIYVSIWIIICICTCINKMIKKHLSLYIYAFSNPLPKSKLFISISKSSMMRQYVPFTLFLNVSIAPDWPFMKIEMSMSIMNVLYVLRKSREKKSGNVLLWWEASEQNISVMGGIRAKHFLIFHNYTQ